MAYYRIEPWGPEARDALHAALCHMIAMCNWSGKGKKPRFRDFVPNWSGKRPRQSVEEMRAVFRSVVQPRGG